MKIFRRLPLNSFITNFKERGGCKMQVSEEWKKDRIAAYEKGENPLAIVKMRSGFVGIGDTQFLPGYCVLTALPKANILTELTFKQRSEYLLDMSIIGEAIEYLCKPLRVNYSIYGNSDSYLHAHIFPRYEWEPEARRKMPVWQYPKEMWSDPEHQFNDEQHGEMREKITRKILEIMKDAY